MINMTDEELLPCPFCGGKVPFIPTYSSYHYSTAICSKCHVQITFPDLKANGESDAIEKWNTRTPSIDSIIRRAVELARVRIKGGIHNVSCEANTTEEIIEQIKKEMGEI